MASSAPVRLQKKGENSRDDDYDVQRVAQRVPRHRPASLAETRHWYSGAGVLVCPAQVARRQGKARQKPKAPGHLKYHLASDAKSCHASADRGGCWYTHSLCLCEPAHHFPLTLLNSSLQHGMALFVIVAVTRTSHPPCLCAQLSSPGQLQWVVAPALSLLKGPPFS